MPPVETSRSQFRQVADQLRAAIEAGEYPPGSELPSELELASDYQVSRQTINQAVRLLRSEGLVLVRRGKGTTVREIPVIHRAALTRYQRQERERGGGRGAFDTEIKGMGLAPRSETTVDTVEAPADVAAALGLEPGAQVVRRQRRMYANDVPVQLAPSYIPADIATGTQLAEVDSGPGGIISRFADLGLPQTRITEAVRVRRPTDEEQQFLRLAEDDQPVVEIFHVGWSGDRAVEVAVHAVPAYGWVLDYAWETS
jgi:GntR family transcriptional regulator